MTRLKHFLLTLSAVLMISSCADTTGLAYLEPTEGTLLLGATVHLGNGDIIPNSAVGLKDGYVTLLADAAVNSLDLSKFQVDKLGPEYHIYPFKKTEFGNRGIVLTRSNAEAISISIRDKELERCITIGCEAMLLICKGSIDNPSQFRVDYVYLGQDKVHIIKQSDYVVAP